MTGDIFDAFDNVTPEMAEPLFDTVKARPLPEGSLEKIKQKVFKASVRPARTGRGVKRLMLYAAVFALVAVIAVSLSLLVKTKTPKTNMNPLPPTQTTSGNTDNTVTSSVFTAEITEKSAATASIVDNPGSTNVTDTSKQPTDVLSSAAASASQTAPSKQTTTDTVTLSTSNTVSGTTGTSKTTLTDRYLGGDTTQTLDFTTSASANGGDTSDSEATQYYGVTTDITQRETEMLLTQTEAETTQNRYEQETTQLYTEPETTQRVSTTEEENTLPDTEIWITETEAEITQAQFCSETETTVTDLFISETTTTETYVAGLTEPEPSEPEPTAYARHLVCVSDDQLSAEIKEEIQYTAKSVSDRYVLRWIVVFEENVYYYFAPKNDTNESWQTFNRETGYCVNFTRGYYRPIAELAAEWEIPLEEDGTFYDFGTREWFIQLENGNCYIKCPANDGRDYKSNISIVKHQF